jgi:hypothetical protein
MTGNGLRLPTLAVAALLAAGALSSASAKDDMPFKNLPGVKVPKQIDKQAKTNCTSDIERQWPRTWRNGLSYRVYECDNGGVIARSTRPPNEIEWKKSKEYYKPWTSDGF